MDACGYRKQVSAGAVIFGEGDAGDCAYIVDHGKIGLATRINGLNIQFTVAKKGDLIGEMALIDDGVRSATATVLADAELLVIPKEYIQRLIKVADPTVVLLIKLVLERYREMRIRVEQISRGLNLEERPHTKKTRESDLKHQTSIAARRLDDEHNLQSALENKELQLYYQPIVDLTSGRILGCEALIRWIHPDKGIVPPMEFIGLAEETGLIVPIGYWIFQEAGRALSVFKQAIDKGSATESFFISVNLSSRQIETQQQIEGIKKALTEGDIDLKSFKIEITESVLMSNPPQIAEVLTGLKQFGIKIALDDFGTGYSSFSYLHRFPIDTLKIDRSFVSTMRKNSKSEAIVRTLCSLAHSLGMDTIAEGIESAEDQQVLENFNCDFGQGYLYSKPVPEEEFISLLKA